MLNAFDLALMRNDVAQLLPDTCVLNQEVRTPDGRGGWSSALQPVTGGTVACRIDPADSEIIIIAAREGLKIEYQFTCPYNAPLAANQRITCNGKTYDLVKLAADHSWNVSKRGYLARVD